MNYQVRNKHRNLIHGELTYTLIGLIYDVRNQYGNGQKEIVYQNALAEKLGSKNITHQREVVITIASEDTGKALGAYRLYFVVDNKVIIETKAMKFTPQKIENQLFDYLKHTPYEVGLLVNFASSRLYIKRVILTKDYANNRSC